MEFLHKLEPTALLVAVLGALNWGILGITDTNVLAEIFGSGTLTDVVYAIVGVAGLALVPRLMEMFHLGGGPEPRGV
jgi:uncharacterized membrane protein YuzA (DUF378 family)